MTHKKWYACSECNKIDSYLVDNNGNTTFPRGEFLAHTDHIIADLQTPEEAQRWLDVMNSNRAGKKLLEENFAEEDQFEE